jgi:hypothetical protein
MKIALCLAGQLRSVEKAYEYINRNLLSKHNVDVFMNFWTPKKEESKEKALELYKPLSWSSQDEFSDAYFSRFTKTGERFWPPRNPYHSFYSVFQSSLLRKEYEIKNGFDYDFIVRTRFDYALNIVIPFEILDKNTIYIPSDRMTKEHDFGSDAFSLGSSKVMDKYCSTYLYLNDYYDNYNVPMIAEHMMSANLKRHGLVGDNLAYVNMNNPFPPNGYDSLPHSYIRDDLHEWK